MHSVVRRVNLWGAVLLFGLSGLGATPCAGQSSQWDYAGLVMTRTDLEELLTEFQSVAGSGVYSTRLRAGAESASQQIRERLDEGDFRVGDRIVLQIVGEVGRSDTVMVEPNKEIALAGMGRISLNGVLRSELQAHLEREIGRYIRAPIIRTLSLIRLSVQGSVGRPGFYVVPATALLDDVIMQAGGPGANADFERVQVERDGVVMLSGDEVRKALTDGRSVDQLNLRAGDQIIINQKTESTIWKTVGRYALIIGAPLLLGVRIF